MMLALSRKVGTQTKIGNPDYQYVLEILGVDYQYKVITIRVTPPIGEAYQVSLAQEPKALWEEKKKKKKFIHSLVLCYREDDIIIIFAGFYENKIPRIAIEADSSVPIARDNLVNPVRKTV